MTLSSTCLGEFDIRNVSTTKKFYNRNVSMTKKFYNISPPIIKYPLSCFIFFILYVTLEYNNWLLYIYARSLSSKYNKTILFWCKKFNKLVSINISLARKPTEEVDILLFHLSGKKKKIPIHDWLHHSSSHFTKVSNFVFKTLAHVYIVHNLV